MLNDEGADEMKSCPLVKLNKQKCFNPRFKGQQSRFAVFSWSLFQVCAAYRVNTADRKQTRPRAAERSGQNGDAHRKPAHTSET